MPRLNLAAALLIVSLAACQAQDTAEPDSPETEASAATEATDAADVAGTAGAADAGTPVPSPEPTETLATAAAVRMNGKPRETGCGADKVGKWLNALPTEEVKADIAKTVGDRAIRYYTQGDPITMDFSPARLNVELGEDGRIKLFRCG